MDAYAEYMDLANESNKKAGKLQVRIRQGLQAGLDVSTQ